VGIAYGSDCKKATEVMVQAALDNSRVLNDPAPKTWFREFGDSSLNFILLCWVPGAAIKFDVISELNHAIDNGFRANGIEIPFPQRDLHLRTSETKLLVKRVGD
jgi:small-conductance mechanosensitive channel